MTSRTSLKLLVACGVVGAVLWFAQTQVHPPREHRELSRKVLSVKAEDITGLIIEHGALRADCVRRDDHWYLQYPPEARANEAEIGRLLSAIEAMQKEQVITAEQQQRRQLTLADYGIEEPQARMVVRGAVSRAEILIGRESPVGGNVYVKLTSAPDIVATSRAILDAVPENLATLRDHTLLYGQVGLTGRIEIRGVKGSFIQLARQGDAWYMQQPERVPADSGKVEGILEGLYASEAQAFVWDPPASELALPAGGEDEALPATPLQSYGLADDEAAARVHLWGRGGEVGQELILGKTGPDSKDLIYAKLRDSASVFTVRRALLDAVSVTANDVRTRSVFWNDPDDVGYACFQQGDIKLVLKKQNDAWMVVEPVQWPADDELVRDLVLRLGALRVQTFVDQVETNVLAAAFERPAYSALLLRDEPVSASAVVQTLSGATRKGDADAAALRGRLIVGNFDSSSSNVLARFENEDLIMSLDAKVLRRLIIRPAQPLLYRDKAMLNLVVDNIRRVSLLKNGEEQSVVRDEEGPWRAEQPADGRVAMPALTELLRFASRLRAGRVEIHNPQDLSKYGLTDSVLALTFGLTGEGGIQKTLLIGRQASPVGVFAMVKGQDVVFVLDLSLAELLTRPLVEAKAVPVAASREGADEEAR